MALLGPVDHAARVRTRKPDGEPGHGNASFVPARPSNELLGESRERRHSWSERSWGFLGAPWRRYAGCRSRVLMGATWHADVWTVLEEEPDVSVAEAARRAGCSLSG